MQEHDRPVGPAQGQADLATTSARGIPSRD
jgi:hypothetical protein